jgi:hypothetical protein
MVRLLYNAYIYCAVYLRLDPVVCPTIDVMQVPFTSPLNSRVHPCGLAKNIVLQCSLDPGSIQALQNNADPVEHRGN